MGVGQAYNAGAVYDARYREGYRTDLRGYEAARAHALRHALSRFVGSLPARRVLDYGCGNGLFHGTIRGALGDVALAGCDVSREALSRLRARDASVELSEIVHDRCAFDSGLFDCVTCVEVLEQGEDLGASLREIARVMRPGGVLVATTPCGNAGSLEHLVARVTGRVERSRTGERRWAWEDPTHLRRLTRREIREALACAGFVRIRLRYRAHAMSYLCTPLCSATSPAWRVRCGEALMKMEYAVLRRVPCAASMVIIAERAGDSS